MNNANRGGKIVSVFISIIALLGLVSWSACHRSQAPPDTFTIGVNQFMQHPLLDSVYKGLVDGLGEKGLSEQNGTKIILKNANGDQNTAFQINKQFVSQNVSMIVPIATPSAQSACKTTTTIPIVFAAITDPVAAGIVDSFNVPGGNKTGTSDLWPYAKQAALVKRIIPGAKTVGIILNPGESNTEASMKLIRPALQDLGLARVEVSVSSTGEVYAAAKSLVGRCDVILVPADNTVTTAFDSVFRVCRDNRLPLFAGSIDLVKRGAIATYGVNYYEIGKATGYLAARILKEKLDPGRVPVVVESKADLVVNSKAAEILGVRLPDSILKEAQSVIGEIQFR